jgi:uncharacterized membrane protein
MTALTAAATMVISIPIPATKGYFNLGDSMVMLAGLLFGASIGGFAGGVGSAISDIALGYAYFSPLTLLIKGTEGFLVGLIGSNRSFRVKVVGVVAGAIAMVVGYFSVESPIYGFGSAFAELVTANVWQVLFGGIIALTICQLVVRAYPDIKILQPKPGTETKKMGLIIVGAVVVLLAAIVALYLVLGISP